MEQLDFITRARETKRFHTVATLQEQTIDGHSWGVAMLLYLIWGQCEPGVSPLLLMAALTHDMAEHKVGDLPAPAKRNMGERLSGLLPHGDFRAHWGDMEQAILAEQGFDFEPFIDDVDKEKLKLCDAMEGALYCVRERSLGNQTIMECFFNFDCYIEDSLAKLKPANHADRDVPFPGEESSITKTPYDFALEVQTHIREQWETVNGGF